MAAPRPYFLVGDVGATNARLAITALRDGAVEWIHEVRVPDAELSSFDDAIDTLFAASPVERTRVAAACLGVAGPIRDHRARFTHRDWTIDAEAIAAMLGGKSVKLVNDLEAAAAGIDALDERDLTVLQRRPTGRGGARLVIGAGTGLGVAYAVWCGNRYQSVASEGGHAGFAPQNARQIRLFDALRAGGQRIDAEHVVCGAGLERIYATLRSERPGTESPALRAELERGEGAAAITRFALEHGDSLASDALDVFIDCYGSVAGDHALAVLPSGGVFVVGGIAVKILPRLAAGGFVHGFTDKGSFRELAGTFPIAVVTNEHLGLTGATLIAKNSVPLPHAASGA
jgi:glucokinase